MNSSKAGRLWIHLGCSVVLFAILAASAAAEGPIDRRLAAGPDWGAPGGTLPPARPGSLDAVPDPRLRAPLTQTAPAAPETVLATRGFTFASTLGAPDTDVAQFPVPGPGKVILEASNTGTPLAKLGLIARAPKPPGQSPVDTRWDGPTPLRVEFPVTAQDLANLAPQGNVWTVFVTLRDLPPPRGTGGRYAIPGLAAVGTLKVSFVADAPAQKTALEPKAVPDRGGNLTGPARSVATKTSPAGTPQAPPGASPPVATTPQAAQPPQAAGNPAPKPSQPAIAAPQPVEPKWPQPFELGAGERTGFGFVAGKPGPIVVNVQWTGVPLTVSLVKPGGGTVDLQGRGTVALKYNATANDVKKGVLWGVSIRPTQVAPKPTAGAGIAVIDKPVKIDTRGVAKGTVNVQHPPGDMNLAQAEWNAGAVKAQALQTKSQPAATAKVDVLAQKQAALQKQQTARQAALLEQVKPKIPVQTYQQMSRRIAVGEQPGASKGIIIVDSGKTNPPGASAMTAVSGIPPAQGRGVAIGEKSPADASMVKPTGTSAQAGVSSVGTGPPPGTIAADPVIASLSVTSGQPRDPILITGSGFSDNPIAAEVHFIVAMEKDVAAPVDYWTDTQIAAYVPDVSGIQAFNGYVYVKRGTSKSKLVSFRFNPSIEIRTIGMTTDRYTPDYVQDVRFPSDGPIHGSTVDPFGKRGDDEFFLSTRLKNGWTVDSAFLSRVSIYSARSVAAGVGDGNAYVSEFRPGTDSLYVKVHWWRGAFSSVGYAPVVVFSGPKGVPHF